MQLSKGYRQTQPNGDDGGRAENSVQRDKKLSLKLAYTPNASDEYALVLSTQKGLKQQPFYSGKNKDMERYWRWPQWNKDSVYFLSHTQFEQHQMYLNTKAFFDTFDNKMSSYDDATFTTQTPKMKNGDSYYRDYSYGAGFELGGNLNADNALKFSALLKQDVHREHNDSDPVAKDKDRTYSFGLENTYRYMPNTKIIAGISFDRREAQRAENFQKCDGHGKQPVICPFEVGDKNAFNYQLKLVHNFDEHDEFALGFAKKTRFATMKDRYSRRFGRFEPNPFLSPETAYHYEMSYMRTFGDWLKLDGALFHSRVKDAIESVPVDKKVSQNQNHGEETFSGVEVAATVFASDNLTLGANYTYTRAKNKTDRDFIIRDIPKHKVFAYVDWRFVPAASLYISQEAEHGRYSTDGFGKKAQLVKLPGFGVTNAKLTYNVTPQLSVDAGVSNLFDKNYYYAAGYPEEGRLYFSNVRYSF
nr:TonB-dependent receptor [Spirabiliibacterium mucosae]